MKRRRTCGSVGEALESTPVEPDALAANKATTYALPGPKHVACFLAAQTKPCTGNMIQSSQLYSMYNAWTNLPHCTPPLGLNTVSSIQAFGLCISELGGFKIHE